MDIHLDIYITLSKINQKPGYLYSTGYMYSTPHPQLGVGSLMLISTPYTGAIFELTGMFRIQFRELQAI